MGVIFSRKDKRNIDYPSELLKVIQTPSLFDDYSRFDSLLYACNESLFISYQGGKPFSFIHSNIKQSEQFDNNKRIRKLLTSNNEVLFALLDDKGNTEWLVVPKGYEDFNCFYANYKLNKPGVIPYLVIKWFFENKVDKDTILNWVSQNIDKRTKLIDSENMSSSNGVLRELTFDEGIAFIKKISKYLEFNILVQKENGKEVISYGYFDEVVSRLPYGATLSFEVFRQRFLKNASRYWIELKE